jgi:hypothetical protein
MLRLGSLYAHAESLISSLLSDSHPELKYLNYPRLIEFYGGKKRLAEDIISFIDPSVRELVNVDLSPEQYDMSIDIHTVITCDKSAANP